MLVPARPPIGHLRTQRPLRGLGAFAYGQDRAQRAVGFPAIRGFGKLEQVSIPPDVQILRIPDSERGTEATLKIMKKLVLSPWGARNPQIVLLANAIRDHVPSKDYAAEADAIFQWVKANVAYKLDPSGMEWIQTPTYTTSRRAGDCDDHSGLIAALAMASGFQAAFRTVAADPTNPTRMSHVYAMIGVSKGGKTQWYASDSTQAESSLGWNPPGVFDMETWVIDPSLEDSSWEF